MSDEKKDVKMTREAFVEHRAELRSLIGSVQSTLNGLPYRDVATLFERLIKFRENFDEANGVFTTCEFCDDPIIEGDHYAYDDENGVHLCKDCIPEASDEEEAAEQPAAPEAEPGSDALAETAGERIIRGAKEALEIARGEREPARVFEVHVQPASEAQSYADSCILKTTQQDAGLMGGYAPVTGGEPAGDVAIPDGFTKWDSGYCPFDIGTHVEVFTRKSGVWPVVIKPEAPLLWEHEGHDLDILAYRVVNYEPAPLIIADPSFVEELGEQSEPYSAAHEAEEPLTPEQLVDLGITDPLAAEMARVSARKLEGVS